MASETSSPVKSEPAAPVKSEPAAVTAIAVAIVDAVVLFADLDLDHDAQHSIVVVLTLVAGFFIRSKVRPVA